MRGFSPTWAEKQVDVRSIASRRKRVGSRVRKWAAREWSVSLEQSNTGAALPTRRMEEAVLDPGEFAVMRLSWAEIG